MATDGESRRSFLGTMTIVLGSVPILGALFVTIRSAFAPAATERPDRVALCRKRELPTGAAILERAVTFEMRRGPLVETVSRVVFVTRERPETDPIAMLGECTHLSCPVQLRSVANTDDTTAPLRCPCHGGKFSRTGEVLDGPPPTPLRRLTLDIPDSDDDIVFVRDL